MISRLLIRNFRSVRLAEIKLGPMNAFIGRNNAGKSNIMKALHLVLGEIYPSIRSFDDKDFHNYDKSQTIQIEARFDAPLTVNSRVQGFRSHGRGIEHRARRSHCKAWAAVARRIRVCAGEVD